jgi:hypothetical protein
MARQIPWDVESDEYQANKGDVNEFLAKQAANVFDGGDMLDKLKMLVVARLDLDEALALIVFADALKKGYEAYGIGVPEWLPINMTKLDAFIREQQGTLLRQSMERAKAKLNKLRPLNEQRAAARKDLEDLQKELDAMLKPMKSLK